jgi:3D (Asp-Asp-Asp) domain-containing protein
MLTLSGTLLFTTSVQSSIMPFQPTTRQLIENKVDKNGMVQYLRLTKFMEQYEKDKKRTEEETKKKKELEEQKKNEPQWQEFILTYYSSLNSENGYGAITSQGKKLSRGGVANNVIPQNTKIYLEGYGQVIVNDKGSNKHFSVDNRLDVFIEREYGESDREYSKRIAKLGVKKVRGYIIK